MLWMLQIKQNDYGQTVVVLEVVVVAVAKAVLNIVERVIIVVALYIGFSCGQYNLKKLELRFEPGCIMYDLDLAYFAKIAIADQENPD